MPGAPGLSRGARVVSIKVRARCENGHFVQVHCWDLSGYYMLQELPPQWHWEVGVIGGEYPTGFIAEGLGFMTIQHIEQWIKEQPDYERWRGYDTSRGKVPSLEEGIKIAKQRHGIICSQTLEPWRSYSEDYGVKEP